MIIPRGTLCQIIRARTIENVDDHQNEVSHYIKMNALVRTAHDYDDEKIDLVDIGVLVHGKDIIGCLHKLLVPTDEYLQYASFRDVRVANSLWPERAATEPKMPGI